MSDASLKPLMAAVHCFSSIGIEAQSQLCSNMTNFDVAAGEDERQEGPCMWLNA